jgi:hypothetical protein
MRVGKPHAFPCQPVGVRRGVDPLAVTGQFVVSEVIRYDEDEVRWTVGGTNLVFLPAYFDIFVDQRVERFSPAYLSDG